jgi:hypothetical protein
LEIEQQFRMQAVLHKFGAVHIQLVGHTCSAQSIQGAYGDGVRVYGACDGNHNVVHELLFCKHSVGDDGAADACDMASYTWVVELVLVHKVIPLA